MGLVITINRTVTDYVAKTRHLSVEDRGAYQEILDQIVILGQEHNPPSLPDDDRVIANILGWTQTKWRKTKTRLCEGREAVLVVAGGRISQTRIVEEIEAAQVRIAAASRAGVASGEARRQLSERLMNERSTQVERVLNVEDNAGATPGQRRGNVDPNGSRTSHESRVMSHEKRKKVKDSSSDFQPDSPPFKLSQHLALRIRENNPKAKEPDLQKWARSIDLMMRIDNRGQDEIRAIIDWSQTDEFWKANILSTDKLREKFDTLTMHSKRRRDDDGARNLFVGDGETHEEMLPPAVRAQEPNEWSEVVTKLGAPEFLADSRLIERENGTLVVGVPTERHVDEIRERYGARIRTHIPRPAEIELRAVRWVG